MIITNLFNRDCRGCYIQSHDAPERMFQRHSIDIVYWKMPESMKVPWQFKQLSDIYYFPEPIH